MEQARHTTTLPRLLTKLVVNDALKSTNCDLGANAAPVCLVVSLSGIGDAAMLVRPHAHRIASTAFGCHRPHLCPRLPSFPTALLSRTRSRDYSAEPTASHDVAVLGGGITGLACAYYLTRELPTAKVTLYEGKDHVGGWIQSKRVPVKGGTVLFESGPRTLRPQSNGVLTASLVRR